MARFKQIAAKIINGPIMSKTMNLTTIGIFGSSLLIVNEFISEWPFVVLVLISVYHDSIQELYFGFKGFRMTRKVLDVLVEKDKEPRHADEIVVRGNLPLPSMSAVITSPQTDAVIKAIGCSKYTWRYLDSLAQELNLPVDDVKDTLNWLLANDFAAEFKGVDGNVYALTQKGREVFARLFSQESPDKTSMRGYA